MGVLEANNRLKHQLKGQLRACASSSQFHHTTVLQAYRVQVSHFCFFCVSLLVSLEMQAAEGRNLTDMYRHHSTSHIWNIISLKVNYVVIFFAVLCTYFSIHSTNFVCKMIPTFLKVKVCDSQRTFYFDQSSRSTIVQSYGKGKVT